MKNRRAFTLIEMMVVIAIVAVLMTVITVAIVNARRAGRIAGCKNNLSQFDKSLEMYKSDWQGNWAPWLSALPELNDQVFLCPLDGSRGTEGCRPDWVAAAIQLTEADDTASCTADAAALALRGDIDACSYLYEFNCAKCSWYTTDDYDIDGDGDTGEACADQYTWQQVKDQEMRVATAKPEFGGTKMGPFTPVVRCYHHIEPNPDGTLYNKEDPPAGNKYSDQRVMNLRINHNISDSYPHPWYPID